MLRLSQPYRIIVLLVVSLFVAGSTMELSAREGVDAAMVVEYSPETTHNGSSESHIKSLSPTVGLSTVTYTSQSAAPIVRTLHRTTRQITRLEQSTVAVRSIDSTQAKSRAGLFNHKILFYTYPRHYYLNGLVRLII